MKKLCSALLLLAVASAACSSQPANSPQTPGAPPAATNQVDDKRDPNAPHNAATEAMSYCIQCVDRTYDQQGVDKTKLDMLKASFDKTMFAISDMMTTKEQKSQAVRDSLEVAKKVIPSVPSLTGLDSSLEEVLKAIDTLPETEIQTPAAQPAQAKGQAPNAQPAPAKGQAPNAQPAPAKGQAPNAQPAQAKGQAPDAQPAPAKGQAPNAQPAPAKGQAPNTQPAPAKGQAPNTQPANSK